MNDISDEVGYITGTVLTPTARFTLTARVNRLTRRCSRAMTPEGFKSGTFLFSASLLPLLFGSHSLSIYQYIVITKS
jgi:hypothetical protein